MTAFRKTAIFKALAVLFVLTASGFAQFSLPPIRVQSSDPANCTTTGGIGELKIYYNTSTSSFKFCSAANTWSAFGGTSLPAISDDGTKVTSTEVIKVPAGAANNASIQSASGTDGFYFPSTTQPGVSSSGSEVVRFVNSGGSTLQLASCPGVGCSVSFGTSGASGAIVVASTKVYRFGQNDSAAPAANTVKIAESSRGGTDTNIAGADGTLQCAGSGTGTGGGGTCHFQQAPAGSTGTTANTYGDFMTVSNQHVKFASNSAPSITAGCGGSPSVSGSDNIMQVNVGTGGAATTCTVTFAKAYAAAPFCFANYEGANNVLTRAVGSTTTVVIDTATAWVASSKVGVACYGN